MTLDYFFLRFSIIYEYQKYVVNRSVTKYSNTSTAILVFQYYSMYFLWYSKYNYSKVFLKHSEYFVEVFLTEFKFYGDIRFNNCLLKTRIYTTE